ncbi:hypothetical protein LTR91_007697 [Friedmanniomyces endolithicus]|uniref:Uncharacterized protein n=1 Tax=Friedmanniomyces endolithicus TaxID=329885 RepID=A0AAN6KQ06_9PEZI|nr:hypothetical protein LTR94_005660 [Friedmanniomyces endolithicus]KAK0798204.1 hypothetical protein LTR59_006516 [Friedmanniomyces endolithicus]KAK0805070.1 hypothetical protein LTR38_005601 [Friedmanniomyces endolithicus]KAK0809729.1 hypothetical protein LTR75_005828 [Friedmanniomyces endolithicus]KAK0837507.1 hypothetical protein LTR03_012755 [Friedmanniomyces endolithicus]
MRFIVYLGARKRSNRKSSLHHPPSPTADAEDKMCKPVPFPVEEWSRPKPAEMEFLVPAESEAGENILNPKVLHMLGIHSVVKFDMLPSGRSVLLAR